MLTHVTFPGEHEHPSLLRRFHDHGGLNEDVYPLFPWLDALVKGETAILNNQLGARQSIQALHRKLDQLIAGEQTSGTTIITIRIGLVRDQTTGAAAATQPGGPAMTQLKDSQQFTFTVEAQDAKGQDVSGETFSASIDDASVATVTQDGATFTVVAGLPGSGVVTVTDGTLSATLAVDVVAGDVATIQIVPSDPTDQAPAAPTDGGDTSAPVDTTPPADTTGGDTSAPTDGSTGSTDTTGTGDTTGTDAPPAADGGVVVPPVVDPTDASQLPDTTGA